MWMAYRKEEKIDSLKSGIDCLRDLFSSLAFDADHEAVYGLGRLYSEEECLKIAHKYHEGVNACDDFLSNQIDLEIFIDKLRGIGIENYIYRIKEYLPDNFKLQFKDEDDNNELEEGEVIESDEEEGEIVDKENVP